MTKAVRGKTQRDFTKANIKKLQAAGLLGPVDLRKKLPDAVKNRISKYRDVLTGKAAVVKAPDLATARKLRKTLGLQGSGKTIVIPREKGETYRLKKSTNEIVSTRKGYNDGEVIHKTLGSRFPAKPAPGSNQRLYYTIPERQRGLGKLKRHTFASFDEMLFYLMKYEINFEDIEDRIEVEEITVGSRRDKVEQKKIHTEREAAVARYKRKRGAKKRAKKPRAKKPRETTYHYEGKTPRKSRR